MDIKLIKLFPMFISIMLFCGCALGTDNKLQLKKSDIMKLHITDVSKVIESTAKGIELRVCKGWTLSQRDITELWKISEVVSDEEFTILYQYLPCDYVGNAEYQGAIIKFKLNAGTTTIFYVGKDNVVKMGCGKKCNKIYDLELY